MQLFAIHRPYDDGVELPRLTVDRQKHIVLEEAETCNSLCVFSLVSFEHRLHRDGVPGTDFWVDATGTSQHHVALAGQADYLELMVFFVVLATVIGFSNPAEVALLSRCCVHCHSDCCSSEQDSF